MIENSLLELSIAQTQEFKRNFYHRLDLIIDLLILCFSLF